jgi:hypothetical protein
MQSLSVASAARYLGQPADPLKLSVDQVKLQVEEIGATLLTVQSNLNSVRTVTTAFEREFPDVRRQLDILAGQLDREKGDVAVLKEQLAFFANGGGRIRNDNAIDSSASRGLYAFLLSLVMRYLYNPFLFFVHGIYSLIAPVLTTFRCLSIFRGSNVRDELSDDDDDSNANPGSSGSMVDAAGVRHLRHETGYLLMALAARPSDQSQHNRHRSKLSGDVPLAGKHQGLSEFTTPFPKATPQRGTELYALLQHTKIDARTTSSKK